MTDDLKIVIKTEVVGWIFLLIELTFSFNAFATLVSILKAIPSASPKLLNLNQDHLSKKVVFLVKFL